MSDELENHTLALLREMRADMTARFNRLDEKLDRISDDVRDLKVRQTATEEAIAGVNRRLDRLEMRAGGSKSASIWLTLSPRAGGFQIDIAPDAMHAGIREAVSGSSHLPGSGAAAASAIGGGGMAAMPQSFHNWVCGLPHPACKA